MDRVEVELSESPAAPANDTSIWSIGDFLAWTGIVSKFVTKETADCKSAVGRPGIPVV